MDAEWGGSGRGKTVREFFFHFTPELANNWSVFAPADVLTIHHHHCQMRSSGRMFIRCCVVFVVCWARCRCLFSVVVVLCSVPMFFVIYFMAKATRKPAGAIFLMISVIFLLCFSPLSGLFPVFSLALPKEMIFPVRMSSRIRSSKLQTSRSSSGALTVIPHSDFHEEVLSFSFACSACS